MLLLYIYNFFSESTPLTEEYTDSIRMLVLLSTGEQRLITFTLPKEQCTIQEILEQVCLCYINQINSLQVTEIEHFCANLLELNLNVLRTGR